MVGYVSHTILFVDLSIAEIDGKRKRKKKVVDNEELILKWRSAHVESNEVRQIDSVQLKWFNHHECRNEWKGGFTIRQFLIQ